MSANLRVGQEVFAIGNPLLASKQRLQPDAMFDHSLEMTLWHCTESAEGNELNQSSLKQSHDSHDQGSA
jgi:hypothetical protein